jgi:hypothetical protein
MQVHVFVGVHMIEPQTGRAKRLELRPHLHRELASNARQKGKPDSGAPHAAVELAVPANETADVGIRQHGITIDDDEMEAYPQAGHPAGKGYGVGYGRSADHQARGRQDAVPVRLFDGLVNGRVEPEIVCADDQAPQLAISRLRRN